MPAHRGIPGNKKAYATANKARCKHRTKMNPSSEKRTIFKTTREKDDFHIVSREDKVVLLRRCFGHNRLNNHKATEMRLHSSPPAFLRPEEPDSGAHPTDIPPATIRWEDLSARGDTIPPPPEDQPPQPSAGTGQDSSIRQANPIVLVTREQ